MLQITWGRDAPARYGAKCSRGRKAHTSRRRNNPRPTRGEMLQGSAARLFDPYPGPPPLPRLVPLSCSAPSSCLPISFAPAFSPLLPHPHQLLLFVATHSGPSLPRRRTRGAASTHPRGSNADDSRRSANFARRVVWFSIVWWLTIPGQALV